MFEKKHAIYFYRLFYYFICHMRLISWFIFYFLSPTQRSVTMSCPLSLAWTLSCLQEPCTSWSVPEVCLRFIVNMTKHVNVMTLLCQRHSTPYSDFFLNILQLQNIYSVYLYNEIFLFLTKEMCFPTWNVPFTPYITKDIRGKKPQWITSCYSAASQSWQQYL